MEMGSMELDPISIDPNSMDQDPGLIEPISRRFGLSEPFQPAT
jgi:hypothetical protein